LELSCLPGFSVFKIANTQRVFDVRYAICSRLKGFGVGSYCNIVPGRWSKDYAVTKTIGFVLEPIAVGLAKLAQLSAGIA
jgi:hypothetical protein